MNRVGDHSAAEVRGERRNMDQTKHGLSILLPVYNERHNLELLHERITRALES
jgi:hypothetical protein